MADDDKQDDKAKAGPERISEVQPNLGQGTLAAPGGLINHPVTPDHLVHDLNNLGDPRQQEPGLVSTRLRVAWNAFATYAQLANPQHVPDDMRAAVELAGA